MADLGKPQTWEIAREGKLPKSGHGRVQKVLWIQGAKVSRESFAPVQEAFFCSLGPKDLLYPPLTKQAFDPFLPKRRFSFSKLLQKSSEITCI